MFSKDESKQLRELFWISFGKSFPHKWILYDTKIKGLAFRFHFDTKMAKVSLDVDTSDLERRIALWEKLISLKTILSADYLPDAVFEEYHVLENGKEISQVYVLMNGVSIHNKSTWQDTMYFLTEKMERFEAFFNDFREVLKI